MSLVYADYQSNLIHHYGGGRLACFEAVSFFFLLALIDVASAEWAYSNSK